MEVIKRLPDSRQTLLFSATLPKLLVEFAKAGLHDPTLIRLDVDTKLSEQLKVHMMQCNCSFMIDYNYLMEHFLYVRAVLSRWTPNNILQNCHCHKRKLGKTA